jgi:hypothetical protein
MTKVYLQKQHENTAADAKDSRTPGKKKIGGPWTWVV